MLDKLHAADSTPSHIDPESGYSPAPRPSKDPVDSFCGIEVSNRTILWVSATTFLLFVIAEVIGALAGNSLSLLGDAAAMSVDAFTYFCNLYAEHVKDKMGKLDEGSRMLLEVYIPTFSVSALIGVSIYVTWEAIAVIMNPPSDDDVNVVIMYGFAIGNMSIDLLSMFLFWVKGSKVLFQPHVHTFSTDDAAPKHVEFLKSEEQRRDRLISLGKESKMNLNMMSAFTHVSGDSLRTLAIFFSALISTLTKYSGALCDAWAAVIVTVTICGIVIPLVREIFSAWRKHYN